MRSLIALLCLASPATAWEAFSEGPVCFLSQESDYGTVLVSKDSRKAQPYAIQLQLDGETWNGGPVFSMRFDGPGRITITTDRHQLSGDSSELIVTDSGFENVLRGLEANFVAVAVLGEQVLLIPLDGAAPEVAKFRACAQGAGV